MAVPTNVIDYERLTKFAAHLSALHNAEIEIKIESSFRNKGTKFVCISMNGHLPDEIVEEVLNASSE